MTRNQPERFGRIFQFRSCQFQVRLYTVRCGWFLWPFLHCTGIFGFLKTQAATTPEVWFSGNISGSSSCDGRCPPVYHIHREEEISKTKIKPIKLKDSNQKLKLRSNLNIKRSKTHYKPHVWLSWVMEWAKSERLRAKA